jgi:xylulose-5-phosphate/fructose-6-phosphate phosphoketolase
MEKPRPVRWPLHGIPINFSTRSQMASYSPFLHLNGYKIANPTILARISSDELRQLFAGYGWNPYLVEGNDPALVHEELATALDKVIEEIKMIKSDPMVRQGERPRWPMIILKNAQRMDRS